MYSKNDYRYYLEHRMAEENYLAHYGVPGMKWKHRKNSSGDLDFQFGQFGLRVKNPKNAAKDARNALNGDRKKARLSVGEDNKRGVKKTSKTNVLKQREHVDRKTKSAPNMYSTNKKSKYSNNKYNHTTEISSPDSKTVHTTYGQKQKKADIKADKKMRRDYINQQNPYSYDANKSLKKNINTNKKVARKRKALKERAYRKVDESYRGV